MKALRTVVSALEDLLRRVGLEAEVLVGLRRAPAPAPELLLPSRVLLEFAEVAVVRVAHADFVRRPLLPHEGWLGVFRALPVRVRVVPQDQVQALSGRDVVCAVALSAEMADAGTLLMLEGVGVLPVVRCPHQTAELQAGPFEIQAQTEIK